MGGPHYEPAPSPSSDISLCSWDDELLKLLAAFAPPSPTPPGLPDRQHPFRLPFAPPWSRMFFVLVMPLKMFPYRISKKQNARVRKQPIHSGRTSEQAAA
jgi:hypothetical protein